MQAMNYTCTYRDAGPESVDHGVSECATTSQELGNGHTASHHLHVRVDVEDLREHGVFVEPVNHHLAADSAWWRCGSDAVITQEAAIAHQTRVRGLTRTRFSTETLAHCARHGVALVGLNRLAHLGQGLTGMTRVN
jgi:hypothetical protein